MTARPGAREAGLDAFELVADYAKSAKGYAIEAKLGPRHDRRRSRATRELVGAAMACPDASAAIHECVLAIKARVPVDVLAETIHAFPSTSRIFNGLFADARREARQAAAASSADATARRSALEDDLRRRGGPCAGASSPARRPARPARRALPPG